MSNAALARSVVRLGADEGVHLGTNATSIRRMLDGTQPRWPVPRLVATALTRRLGYDVTAAQCGFEQHDSGDTFDAFECHPTIDGTIAIVAELSGRDINRRNFLLGSAFSAAAFAQPAWLALTLPPSPDDSVRHASTDAQVILDTVRHYERLHRRFGGGVVREQVVTFVHHHTKTIADNRRLTRVNSETLQAIAQATWLAGLTSVDAGRHALGQRYYAQALNLATQCGDRLFAANVLSEMSRVTVDVGNATDDPQVAIQHGQRATALAHSAIQVAADAATPAFGAWLHAIRARSLALIGNVSDTRQAVEDSQRSYEHPGNAEPEWFGFYAESDLLTDTGQCLRDVGRPRQGLALLERAAQSLPSHRVTTRVKTYIHLAAAHLELNDYAAADTTAADAIDAADALRSGRILDRLDALRRRARQHGQHPRIQQLDDRIGVVLSNARG